MVILGEKVLTRVRVKRAFYDNLPRLGRAMQKTSFFLCSSLALH